MKSTRLLLPFLCMAVIIPIHPAFAADTAATKGHPVKFEYDVGAGRKMMDSLVIMVSNAGCPASSVEKDMHGKVTAETNGKRDIFENATEAAGWALEHCMKETQPK